MQIRKLVKSGPGSYVISVPKNWLDRHSLHKGDLLYINEEEADVLTISPTVKKKKERQSRYEIDAAEHPGIIERKIVAAYIDNCDIVTISGKKIGEDVLAGIQRQVDELAGFEIIFHDPTKIIIKDMLDVENISITETIRKMDMITRLMFADMRRSLRNENVAALVEERDTTELNKLYFLAFRLIKIALEDGEKQRREKLDNFHLISHLRLIVLLEDMADQIKRVCDFLEREKNRRISELIEIAREMEKEYVKMITAYFKRDREAAYEYYLNRRNTRKMCEAYFKKNRNLKNLNIVVVLQKLMQIGKLTEDISKIIRYL